MAFYPRPRKAGGRADLRFRRGILDQLPGLCEALYPAGDLQLEPRQPHRRRPFRETQVGNVHVRGRVGAGRHRRRMQELSGYLSTYLGTSRQGRI